VYAAAGLVIAELAACGTRTALDVPEEGEHVDGAEHDSSGEVDAAYENTSNADTAEDVRAEDVSRESSADAGDLDAHRPDAEWVPPVIDAAPPFDAAPSCPSGAFTGAFLIAESGSLYRFAPETASAQRVGGVTCPAGTASPWTLAVSKDGIAYVLYSDWNIYRLDLVSLGCTATPYVSGQLSFPGNVSIAISAGIAPERLIVYGAKNGPPWLASSDLTSFALADIGPITPDPREFPVDTQADAYGRLFALTKSGALLQINPNTGSLIAKDQTAFSATAGGWAVLTWNAQVYFFGGTTGAVQRYDLAAKTLTAIGTIGDTIVGASAAPCIQ
jgi:hypothetical protein